MMIGIQFNENIQLALSVYTQFRTQLFSHDYVKRLTRALILLETLALYKPCLLYTSDAADE